MGGIPVQFAADCAAHCAARAVTSNNIFCVHNLFSTAAIRIRAFKVNGDGVISPVWINAQICDLKIVIWF